MPENEIFEQLAAEEPPIEGEDTNPSATKPRLAVEVGGLSNRLVSAIILVLALVMIAAGGFLLLTNEEDTDDNTDDAPTQMVEGGETETLQPTNTAQPTETQPPLPTAIARNQPLHTAAVDEQMLALLTPVPGEEDGEGVVRRDEAPFTEQIGAVQNSFVNYTVQSNDTLESIKNKFGLGDICTIVWSNERNRVSPLRPGAEITIPPVDGVYAKVREAVTIQELAENTGVDAFTIIDSPYNASALLEARPDSLLVEGLQVMVPGGNGGNCNIWVANASITGSGGQAVTSNTGQFSLWGCNANVTGGGFPTLNPLAGGYQFFQGFSFAHTGVDLSANEGTPVGAAGAGTVVFSGWNEYGYGNTIVIAHGTTFTLYGHLSSRSVSCGQDVSGGQTIGTVGNTGRSSGPHLHFEIRNAGFVPLDPVYTIGF